MRTKVTLILVFLNVALFVFIFKFERTWRTERAALEARRRVLGPETADIRSLDISGPDLTRVHLVRNGQGWSLTKPIDWPANPHAVDRIVNELQFLQHVTSFRVSDLAKSGQSLKDYGLDHPRLVLTFTSGNATDEASRPGSSETLRIGDETKVGNRLYLLSPDGQRIHVVDASLAKDLTLPIKELRADTIFSIPVFEARSLNLQNRSNLRVRVRREGDHWLFESPIAARASKIATELTINALNGLQVHKFLPPNPANPTPAANPSLRITLEGNNRRQTLILGDPVGTPPTAKGNGAGAASPAAVEYYAVLDGRSALFTVDLSTGLLRVLRNAQVDLRDKHVLDFQPSKVTSITLTAPNRPEVTLQRLEASATDGGSESWQIVRRDATKGPQTVAADSKEVKHLLDNLARLSAKTFLSDAPSDADLETWGFNRPEREVTLTFPQSTGLPSLKLQIGLASEPGPVAYARVTNAPYVYEVDRSILDQTNVSPLAYRNRLLRALPDAARITALKLTDLSDQHVVFAGSPPAKTAGKPRDRALRQLVAGLRTLRAERFVEGDFTKEVTVAGEERPWRYRLDATVVLPGGAGQQTETTRIFFTARVGGGTQLAGSPEFGAVFAIEQNMIDALWSLTHPTDETSPAPVRTPPKTTAPVDTATPAKATSQVPPPPAGSARSKSSSAVPTAPAASPKPGK